MVVVEEALAEGNKGLMCAVKEQVIDCIVHHHITLIQVQTMIARR
jgi:hypothetical protein